MKACKAVIDAVWAEAAMLLAVLANTLIFVALTGPAWAKQNRNSGGVQTMGLWRVCHAENTMGETYCFGTGSYKFPVWFVSVQALVTTCTVGLILAFAVMVVFACVDRAKQDRRLLIVYILSTFVFAVIGVAGVSLFGNRANELLIDGYPLKIAWSFILAATGLCVHFLCIILVIVDLIIGRRTPPLSESAPVIADAAAMGTSAPAPVSMVSVA